MGPLEQRPEALVGAGRTGDVDRIEHFHRQVVAPVARLRRIEALAAPDDTEAVLRPQRLQAVLGRLVIGDGAYRPHEADREFLGREPGEPLRVPGQSADDLPNQGVAPGQVRWGLGFRVRRRGGRFGFGRRFGGRRFDGGGRGLRRTFAVHASPAARVPPPEDDRRADRDHGRDDDDRHRAGTFGRLFFRRAASLPAQVQRQIEARTANIRLVLLRQRLLRPIPARRLVVHWDSVTPRIRRSFRHRGAATAGRRPVQAARARFGRMPRSTSMPSVRPSIVNSNIGNTCRIR